MAGMKCKTFTCRDFMCGVCACLNIAVVMTMLQSLNVLFTDWLNFFGADRASTAVVQATCFGVTHGAGLLAGMLIRKLEERVSLLLGTALATAGFLTGGFVISLPALIVSVGVVTASGFCLIYMSTISTTLRRFAKKAGFLSSAMTCSGGLMNLGTPLFFRYLSEQYTWRGCLVLSAGILLNIAIFSLLLTSPLLHNTPTKPPPISSTLSDYDIVAYDVQSDVTENDAVQIHPPSDTLVVDINHRLSVREGAVETEVLNTESNFYVGSAEVIHHVETKSDDVNAKESKENVFLASAELDEEVKNASSVLLSKGASDSGKKHVTNNTENCFSRFKSQSVFLKDPLYICVTFCTVVSFSTVLAYVFLVLDFAIHKGWSVQDGIFLNFMFQLLGVISRALVGVVSLHKRVRSIALLIVSGMISGVAVLSAGQVKTFVMSGLVLVFMVSSFPLAAVLYACMGLGYGGISAMFPAAVFEVTGPGPAYSVALGLSFTIEGISEAVFGVLAGFLVDVHQSYSVISFVYGPLCLGVTTLLLYVYLCCSRSRRSPDMAS